MKHHKIIGVPEVMPFFEAVLHKLVELIEINVGKELRCQITDGKASRFILACGEFRAEAFYHVSKQPSRVFVVNLLKENLEHDAMVDTRKKLPHIAFKNPERPLEIVAFTASIRDELIDAFMGALANSAGVRIVNEGWLEHGREVVHDGVMEHAVAHGRFVNMAQFGVLNEKRSIRPVPVFFGRERSLKIPEIVFKMPLEFHNVGFALFANLESSP
jgi:hypothetical protein